jgi:predicted transcriptional regulator
MKQLGYVDEEGKPLYSFHGLSKNAICYLTELGLDEGTIGALVGKTPETVRHYAKEARLWMLAERAAETVIAGRIERLVGKSAADGGK